jgi:hypothetical protein
MLERQETQISLQDAGGLLSSSPAASQSEDAQASSQTPDPEFQDEDADSFDLTTSRSNNNNSYNRNMRLQDLGSFLASNRRTDVDNNIEMRRFDVRNTRMRGPPAPSTTLQRPTTNNSSNNNNRSTSSPAGYESMNLHDPGGLLRRWTLVSFDTYGQGKEIPRNLPIFEGSCHINGLDVLLFLFSCALLYRFLGDLEEVGWLAFCFPGFSLPIFRVVLRSFCPHFVLSIVWYPGLFLAIFFLSIFGGYWGLSFGLSHFCICEPCLLFWHAWNSSST